MYFAFNWHKDQIGGNYFRLFTNPRLRNTFGNYLRDNLKNVYIRYPGGRETQDFQFEHSKASLNFEQPGYPIFFKFVKEFNCKIIHQLPTSGWTDENGVKCRVKQSVTSPLDMKLVTELTEYVTEYVIWVKSMGYDNQIVYWELGNEDWIDYECRLSPFEYYSIISILINKLSLYIDSSKLIICAQPDTLAGSTNWGHDVLVLLKKYNLHKKFGGVSLHIYPCFQNVNLCSGNHFDFNQYAFSDELIHTFRLIFEKLTVSLNDLNYPSDVKVHITEMSIDVPYSNSPKIQSFDNNKKNLAAAFASIRCLSSIISNIRFSGACYHSLTHRYLIENENNNPTKWRGFTKVTDWGWGQLWYLADQNKFICTPLLYIWSILSSYIDINSSVFRLSDSSFLFQANNLQTLLIFNYNGSTNSKYIPLSNVSKLVSIESNSLGFRTLKPTTYGSPSDIIPLKYQIVKHPTYLILKNYYLYILIGSHIKFNKLQVSNKFVNTKVVQNDNYLPFGEYYISYHGGKLHVFPPNATFINYPLDSIVGLGHLSESEVSLLLLGEFFDNIVEWEFSGS